MCLYGVDGDVHLFTYFFIFFAVEKTSLKDLACLRRELVDGRHYSGDAFMMFIVIGGFFPVIRVLGDGGFISAFYITVSQIVYAAVAY